MCCYRKETWLSLDHFQGGNYGFTLALCCDFDFLYSHHQCLRYAYKVMVANNKLSLRPISIFFHFMKLNIHSHSFCVSLQNTTVTYIGTSDNTGCEALMDRFSTNPKSPVHGFTLPTLPDRFVVRIEY